MPRSVKDGGSLRPRDIEAEFPEVGHARVLDDGAGKGYGTCCVCNRLARFALRVGTRHGCLSLRFCAVCFGRVKEDLKACL